MSCVIQAQISLFAFWVQLISLISVAYRCEKMWFVNIENSHCVLTN